LQGEEGEVGGGRGGGGRGEGGAGLEDAHDVGGVEGAADADLPQEALDAARIGEELAAQELDGGLGAGGGVARFVDFAHGAAAEDVAQLPGADDLVGEPARLADLEGAVEVAA